MRSSLSTEFDPILKSPGSPEISILYPPVLGGVLGLPVRLRIAHWLTASSNSRLLHRPPSHPVSSRPAHVICCLLSPPLWGSVRPLLISSGGSSIVSRNRYGRTHSGEVRLGPEGWLSDSAGLLSPRGDCTLVVSPLRVASIEPPCSGPVVSPSTIRCLLLLWFLRGLSREFG
jgi:hypothetical protein